MRGERSFDRGKRGEGRVLTKETRKIGGLELTKEMGWERWWVGVLQRRWLLGRRWVMAETFEEGCGTVAVEAI